MKNPKDITINGLQLSDILESHKKWIMDDESGTRADLTGADLTRAYLRGAYLTRADLTGADLTGADLTGAYLTGAYLTGAYLTGAYLTGAYLTRADLRGADLRGAYLTRADLTGADLTGADLTGADLTGAKNIEFIEAITSILPEGHIIGWKKCAEGVVKLEIPADAKRSNATGRKCRAEFAIDLAHYLPDGTETDQPFHSSYDEDFVYRVGDVIRPNKWDEDRWNECSNGVHFFITRLEAERY